MFTNGGAVCEMGVCLRKTQFEKRCALVYKRRNSKQNAPLFTKCAIRKQKRHCLRKAPFENKCATVCEMRNSKRFAPLFAKCAIRKQKRHCLRKAPFETKTAIRPQLYPRLQNT